MDFNYFATLSGITPDEMSFLQQAVAGLNENQKRQFLSIYAGKRRSPQDILLLPY